MAMAKTHSPAWILIGLGVFVFLCATTPTEAEETNLRASESLRMAMYLGGTKGHSRSKKDKKSKGSTTDGCGDSGCSDGQVCCVLRDSGDSFESKCKDRSWCVEHSGTPINGNLQVPSKKKDLQKIAHEEEEPQYNGKKIGYETLEGGLFPHGPPHYDDVDQGHLGDCWFLAGLQSILAVKEWGPQFIVDSILKDGDKTYVRLFSPSKPVLIEVNSAYPDRASRIGNHDGKWVSMFEEAAAAFKREAGTSVWIWDKALPEAKRPQIVESHVYAFDDDTAKEPDFQTLDGGTGMEVFAMLTGQEKSVMTVWSRGLSMEIYTVLHTLADCKISPDGDEMNGDCEHWTNEAVPLLKKELKGRGPNGEESETPLWEVYKDMEDGKRDGQDVSTHLPLLRLGDWIDFCKVVKKKAKKSASMCKEYTSIFAKGKTEGMRIPGAITQALYTDVMDKVFDKLKRWTDSSKPIWAGAKSPENEEDGDTKGPKGMYYGHAYSIINVEQEDDGHKYISVGNPHGNTGAQRTTNDDDEAEESEGTVSVLNLSDFAEHFRNVYACENCSAEALLNPNRHGGEEEEDD